MKNHFFGICLFVLMCVFVPLQVSAVQMVISYEDKEQPPYYMGNSETILEKPGVAVEMIQILEKKIDGLKITLRRTPWKRCTFELGTNSVDGIFNASYKKKRLKIGWYPTTDKTLRAEIILGTPIGTPRLFR
ncbi:hypothetical protein QUF76_14430 [Desulfobacterales bacterium HSG16]|nr:hypothetical protein [Desulfobacterales bacterium HSG16]